MSTGETQQRHSSVYLDVALLPATGSRHHCCCKEALGYVLTAISKQ